MRFSTLKLLAGIGSAAAASLILSTAAYAAGPDHAASVAVTQTQPVNAVVVAEVNPIAWAISHYYSAPIAEVEALRSLGARWGYNNIAKIYAVAHAAGISPTLVIQMRAGGMEWGQISRELNVPHSAINLGRIVRAARSGQTVDTLQQDESSGGQTRKPTRRRRVNTTPKVRPPPKARASRPVPGRRVRPPVRRPQPPMQRVRPPKKNGR